MHGITDEMAAAGESEGAAAEGMLTALNYAWARRIPVVGHNVTYDLTVLDRALRRTHGHPLTVAGPVIDSLVLDRMTDKYRKGRRTLTASAALYGIGLLNAHSADSDASTSVGIVRAIGERRPEVAAMTTAELFEAQTQANEKWAANLDSYFRSKGTWTSTVRGEWPVLPVN